MCDKVIKKVRGSNSTREEELLLLEEVRKEQHIIECKVTNKTSNVEKDKAWERISNSFNAKNAVCRSADQLKSKYDNIKTKARKKVANQRAFCKGTGGGPFLGDGFDPVIEAILNIINIKTVVGMKAQIDSDSCTSESSSWAGTAQCDIEVPEAPALDFHRIPVEVTVIHEFAANILSEGSNIYLSEPVEIPLSEDHEPVIVCESTLANKDANDPPISVGTPKIDKKLTTDWSHYVPDKMKETVSKKLRPPVRNNIQDEYYKIRMEVLKKELKEQQLRADREKKEEERREISFWKEEDRREKEYERKAKREQIEEERKKEEHDLKIKLLKLQILHLETDK